MAIALARNPNHDQTKLATVKFIKPTMIKLLFCAVPLHSKDFYLTVNVIDIIMTILFSGLFAVKVGINLKFEYTHIDWLLDLFLFIFAVLALVYYFNKRSYRTDVHKIYMISRLFLTIFKLIMVALSLFSFIINTELKKYQKRPDIYVVSLLAWSAICAYQMLSTYWSFHLMKIIN